jgi:4'-phosphopantetheinyl transferase
MTVGWLARGLDQLPDGEGWLSPAEAERAAGMRFTKRRSEFLVARYAAKLAIARTLGAPTTQPSELAQVEVRHRATGAPLAHVAGVAAPVSMSLTDRADWAVCVVSADPDLAVGCDLELVEPRSPAFVRAYLTPDEQRTVATTDDPHLTANVQWSAKESALKVLQTGLRRDTRSVEVHLGGDEVAGWRALEVRAVEGASFPGWWRRWGSFLLTVTASSALAPPRALEDPSGLEDAVPSHRWVDRPIG